MAKSIIPFLPLFLLLVIVVDVTNAQKVCTTNAQCRRNSCIIGFCRSPSQIGGQCDVANGGDDGDCVGGNVCINSQCSSPSAFGEECDDVDDGDCDDGLFCLNTVCNPTSCTSNSECSTGNTCIDNVCAPLSDVGESCDAIDESGSNTGDDGDCVGGNVCINAQCEVPSVLGEECDDVDDGDCDDGLFCLNGFCNPTSCTSNSECSTGNTCIDNICAPLSDVGDSCDAIDESGSNTGDDGDCVGENVCINAQCEVPSVLGEECDNGDDGDCEVGLVCKSSTCYQPWVSLATMPQSRARGAAGTIGDSIFISTGAFTGATSRFKPDLSPQWPTSPSFDNFPPGTRISLTSAVVDGKLFVMGGQASGSVLDQTWSFDPSQSSGSTPSNQWKALTAMPAPRSGPCSAAFGTRIYLFGGFFSSNPTNTVFVFNPSADSGMGSWTTLSATLPQSFGSCAAAQEGQYIYITGGTVDGGSTYLNTIYRFRPDGSGGGAFDPFPVGAVPVLITARYAHSATTVNGKIIVAGGSTSGSLKSVEMFDPSSNTVSSLPDMNIRHQYHQASAIGSNLFVFGGIGAGGTETTAESLLLPA